MLFKQFFTKFSVRNSFPVLGHMRHLTLKGQMSKGVQSSKYVLVDTDAGTDDAHAIFMLLRAHKAKNLQVVGITCVAGNTIVDNVVRNVTHILKVAEVDDIPIFRGAAEAMVVPYVHHEDPPYHGHDGFGDTSLSKYTDPKVETENAVSALIRLSYEFRGKLGILALGPLTNLALAVKLDPCVATNVNTLHIMGGNIEGKGNTTPCAEFNFIADPEAAFVTLSAFKSQTYIYAWELCLRHGAQSYDWRIEEFKKLKTPMSDFMELIEKKLLVGAKASRRWIPCDQVVVAGFLCPQMVTETENLHCTVELQGVHSRGLMVVR